MADKKISELTEILGAGLADDDLLPLVDSSATETKKIRYDEFFNQVLISSNVQTFANNAQASATAAAVSESNASASETIVTNALTQVNSGQKDIFVNGTNFTSGTTTILTLSQTPAKANFVHVFFDTDYQASDTYTIVGNVITFDSAIVATKVEIVYDVAKTLIEDALWNLADKRARASFAREKNTPVIPTLFLDFEGDKELDPRVTFARASTARYYDGKTVAKAEENLLIRSQELQLWSNLIRTTASDNSTVAPDGTTTAATLSETATTGVHYAGNRVASVISGLNYAFSVFLKKGNGATAPDVVQVSWDGASGGFSLNSYANFDLNAGTVTASGVGATGVTITAVGGGWYRCSFIAVATATIANNGINILFCNNNGSATRATSYAGATTSDVFVWGAQLEQRSTVTAYTATTTQPITNYIPVLLSAANNEARFDHNPTTSESLGLLIEEQRTNLLLRSEEFDNAYWGKVRTSIEANTIVAPDGTLTGDRLVEDTQTGVHAVTTNFSAISGTTYTNSFYVKTSGRDVVLEFSSSGFGVAQRINFDLTAKTFSISAGTPIGTLQEVGNGWLRISITATATATTTAGLTAYVSIGGTRSYAGDGFSGIFIWGAQLEAGAFPTSYIPTVASQVTRSADAASMTGTNFSSWYRQDEGSVYANFQPNAVGPATTAQGVFRIFGGTNNTIDFFKRANSDASTRFQVISSSGTSIFTNTGTFTTDATKVIGRYKVNDFGAARNGVLSSTSVTGNVPVVSEMFIGALSSSGLSALNGTMKKLAFYPKRLTDTQLQAITT